MKRRNFIKKSAFTLTGTGLASMAFTSCSDLLSESAALQLKGELPATGLPFKISLAQWSLHKSFWAGILDNLDFAQYTKEKFDF